jgi:hypothetical protein
MDGEEGIFRKGVRHACMQYLCDGAAYPFGLSIGVDATGCTVDTQETHSNTRVVGETRELCDWGNHS